MLHTTTLLHLVPAIGCIQRIPFVTVIGHVPFTARRHSASARRTNGRGFHCEIAVSNGTNRRRVHQTTGLPNFHPRKASWSLWKDIPKWLLFRWQESFILTPKWSTTKTIPKWPIPIFGPQIRRLSPCAVVGRICAPLCDVDRIFSRHWLSFLSKRMDFSA